MSVAVWREKIPKENLKKCARSDTVMNHLLINVVFLEFFEATTSAAMFCF
jgi:hypothetical protein